MRLIIARNKALSLTIRYKDTHKAYIPGVKARRYNKPKAAPLPAYTDKAFCLKHLWLAGWNDTDIELFNKPNKGIE
ncbi:hypothetical protein [Entomomonas asaccharolytica]|uniref:Uncharacterized protein n=1 Tax=Entomomonas asaccharolytica TaxID=2785331 RepID=A0A974ND93_9GAMM|nr:hypothetical protein [Entomomonas asaccharolytica]QQP84475.1 hypothetical protein JHT90_08565 [Entomomonas asaccharolytica]